MARRVILLLGLLIGVLGLALATNSARAFRERIFADRRAETMVMSRTDAGDVEEIPWRTFMLKRVATKQLNPLSFWLVNQTVGVLWSAIYALAGLAGGCIYLLLLIIEPSVVGRTSSEVDAALQAGRLMARLVVAAGAGLLAYLVLLLPASLAIVPLKSLGAATSDLYASLLLLPAAAGIFISTFFEKIRMWLDRIMTTSENTKKKDGSKP